MTIENQYFICLPLAANSSSIWWGIRFIQFFFYFHQWTIDILIRATMRSLLVVAAVLLIPVVMNYQMFFIRFISDEFPGQSRIWTLFSGKNLPITSTLWQLASSCIKIRFSRSSGHYFICENTLSFKTTLYWLVFMVPPTIYKRLGLLIPIANNTMYCSYFASRNNTFRMKFFTLSSSYQLWFFINHLENWLVRRISLRKRKNLNIYFKNFIRKLIKRNKLTINYTFPIINYKIFILFCRSKTFLDYGLCEFVSEQDFCLAGLPS